MACARCSSTSGCGCSLVAGTGITINGFGTVISPWVVNATDVPCARVVACQTITTLVNNGNGTFTYTSEDGTQTVITDIVTTLVDNGNGTYTYTSENGTITNISDVVTTLTNVGGGQYNYVNEVGAISSFIIPPPTLCEDIQDCVAPMMLGNGFIYDDANGQWDTTGAVGSYLTSNGAGGAIWTLPILPPAETAWTGTGSGLVTVTPGGVNGHAPVIGVSCAAVQACVGPIPPSMQFSILGQAFPCGQSNNGLATVDQGEQIQVRALPGMVVNVTDAAPFNFLDIGPRLPPVGFPFPCADTNGMPIYCTADGLRTNPDHSTVVTPRNVAATGGSPGVGASNFAITGVAFNNPSPCRSMGVLMHYGYGSSVTDLPGGNTGTDWDFNIAGSPGYNGTFQYFQINPNAGTTEFGPERVSMQSMNWDQFVIGPGGAFVTVITSAATPRVGAGVQCTTFAVISGFGTTG